MNRYDYYESMERRIEKLERELARKDELFGLFKKKDKGSKGVKSVRLTRDQLDDFLSDLKKYEPSVINNTSSKVEELESSRGKFHVLRIVCRPYATDFDMEFNMSDSSNDGKTATVKAQLGSKALDSFTFDITKSSAIKGACKWIESALRNAITDYNEKARKRGNKVVTFKH